MRGKRRGVRVELAATAEGLMALAEGIGAAMADMWLDGELEFGDGAHGRLEKSNAEQVEGLKP